MHPTIEIYCVILRAILGHFLYELLVEGVMVKDAVSATTPANGASKLRWPPGCQGNIRANTSPVKAASSVSVL